MSTVVELGVVEGFILDDPIAGVLDNIVYTLGGTVFADITANMIQATITRGKNRDLDRYSAGVLSVTLNNQQRTFDPTYASGPYFGQIIPRRPVRITVDGVRQFTGVIDDWNLNYSPGGISQAELAASDDFTFLARQQVEAGSATPQLSGARVSAVLDMNSVNWPVGARTISEGESVLGADVFTGNALEYLQKVAVSEQGQLFIGKDGNLTFLSRSDATPSSTNLVDFADDGTGIPYTQVLVNFGTELPVNTVTVTSPAGTAIAQNDRSRTVYGVIGENIDTLVNSSEQLANLADFVVQKYGDPEYRFAGVRMNLDIMSTPQKAQVLGMELGDVVKITFTPNNIGSPIVQYGQVIRLDHDIQRERHDITLGVAAIDWTFLVLDDTLFGTLDNRHLGF
jgi:hypothetical protein